MTLALVTGGCGFLGRHLVEVLRARGDEVRVLDIAEPGTEAAGVEWRRGSILDQAALESALEDVDCVYHLAGIAHFWTADRNAFDRINRHGTELLIGVAAKRRIRRVVHCSTESILLPKWRKGGLIDESAPPPLSDMPGPYTRSKHLAERAALDAARHGMNLVVVNPTVPVGPGDRNMTPPGAMLALFLSGRSPLFLDCVLNLVDVRDVAAGIALAGARGRQGERYILGGENMSLRDLLPLLERLSGRRMPQRAVPPFLALVSGSVAGFIADWITHTPPAATREGVILALRSAPFDSGKARRELGYEPAPIEKALTEAVEEFKRSEPNGSHRQLFDK
jgi:dihydroflavonol-4-reductase